VASPNACDYASRPSNPGLANVSTTCRTYGAHEFDGNRNAKNISPRWVFAIATQKEINDLQLSVFTFCFDTKSNTRLTKHSGRKKSRRH
jgi:hypothetical protein